MGDPYDPLDFETWPEEQKEFAGRVWRGLHDGDLMPLAAYLRAGHYIEPALACEIADAIEGVDAGFYHIVTKGRFPGQKGITASTGDHDRKLEVGVFMEDRLRTYGRGGYESALRETKAKFQIASNATVAKSLRYLRAYLANTRTIPGWDHWEYLRAAYITP